MTEFFEVGTSSIDPSITLIEASAGTGKTYAIAGMVVRLVAEKDYGLDRILVVTFTEAATRELRDRVRSRIRDAVTLLEEGRADQDAALANLVEADSVRVQCAIRSLKNALLGFDEAAIFTIHGFCQRMLRENAFETGALFDVELVTDAEPIWRETAEDFWRKQFYMAEPEIGSLVVALQAQGRLSTKGLVDLLRKVSRHPELMILSGKEAFSLSGCQEKLVEAIGGVRQEWMISREEVGGILRATKSLSVNQKAGYPPAAIDGILDTLGTLEGGGAFPPDVWMALRKLSSHQLEAATKKKKEPPRHRFFELCADLEELVEAFVRLVRSCFMESLGDELAKAKKRRNVITFDDLLTRLYHALKRPGGGKLSSAIGERFAAALIDEFQDTDPVQWEIFYRIFGGGKHLLFLIGDPKQAIYGFRGADIFTYMEAREKAGARYSLGKNWRSDKRLVEGANQLFLRHDEVFVFPEITFAPVAAADTGEKAELDLGGSDLSHQPLQLACVEPEDEGTMTVPEAKDRILGILRKEICRLLGTGVKRAGRLLEPGDIAVLVRTNREAESVRETLVQAGIPAVVRTDRSVLQTEEAEHLLRLLAAILEPHKNGLVKAALVSPLFGFDAGRIHEIDQAEMEWQALTAKFHDWREEWNRHGFMRMFRSFLVGEGVRTRLLGLRDGERMVTNYQHVAECLHSVEYERIMTPSTLLRWLREQNERLEGDGESYVIRLEKDEKAVQIVTIHRSKGLEYPVVFCPFNWTNVVGKAASKEVVFHNSADGNRLTWDLRPEPDPAHVEAFKREQLAEAIRLLYVAVTRARNRCYLFWAVTRDSSKADNCSLAHLFGSGREGGPETVFTAFETMVAAGHAAMHAAGPEEEAFGYRVLKAEAAGLSARKFDRDLLQGPLITSFSGLTVRAHDEAPDRDTQSVVVPVPEGRNDSRTSIFTFPKGAKAGNFFHGLLEDLDFTRADTLPELVEKQLKDYGFDGGFAPVITAKLQELLALPMPGGVKLEEIGKRDRLVEAPFYFPICGVTPPELGALFNRENLPESFSRGLGRLGFYPVDGYMTGFIDLVVRHDGRFYVIDWKSNWLGGDVSHYREEALCGAMADSYYYLQYHLYVLALDRHLACTLPDYDYDRDFGGVMYVFLRGVETANPKSGIFYDRPSKTLMDRLRAKLMKEAEVRG